MFQLVGNDDNDVMVTLSHESSLFKGCPLPRAQTEVKSSLGLSVKINSSVL